MLRDSPRVWSSPSCSPSILSPLHLRAPCSACRARRLARRRARRRRAARCRSVEGCHTGRHRHSGTATVADCQRHRKNRRSAAAYEDGEWSRAHHRVRDRSRDNSRRWRRRRRGGCRARPSLLLEQAAYDLPLDPLLHSKSVALHPDGSARRAGTGSRAPVGRRHLGSRQEADLVRRPDFHLNALEREASRGCRGRDAARRRRCCPDRGDEGQHDREHDRRDEEGDEQLHERRSSVTWLPDASVERSSPCCPVSRCVTSSVSAHPRTTCRLPLTDSLLPPAPDQLTMIVTSTRLVAATLATVVSVVVVL